MPWDRFAEPGDRGLSGLLARIHPFGKGTTARAGERSGGHFCWLAVRPRSIRIVYDNLLSNAVKYGREGCRLVLDAKENESKEGEWVRFDFSLPKISTGKHA